MTFFQTMVSLHNFFYCWPWLSMIHWQNLIQASSKSLVALSRIVEVMQLCSILHSAMTRKPSNDKLLVPIKAW